MSKTGEERIKLSFTKVGSGCLKGEKDILRDCKQKLPTQLATMVGASSAAFWTDRQTDRQTDERNLHRVELSQLFSFRFLFIIIPADRASLPLSFSSASI